MAVEISPSDISVVVQGPVVGLPDDPSDQRLTEACLRSVRTHFPGAEIVLSTWRGTECSGLSYDILVENEDPGQLAYLVAAKANPNINRMIASSRNGIAFATRPFVLKSRTDILFTGPQLISWWARFPKRRAGLRVFAERVIVPTVFTAQPRRRVEDRLYHLSDWLQFGTRADVAAIWSCPPARELPDEPRERGFPSVAGDLDLSQFSAEQYIWLHCVARVTELSLAHPWDVPPQTLRQFEEFLANEVILVEPDQLGIRHLKYRLRLMGKLSNFTHGEWRRLYRADCDPNVKCPWDWGGWWRRSLARANVLSGRRLLPTINWMARMVRRMPRKLG